MALNPRITGWKGRRAWLVGASSGIGRATASALHARGAQVVVSARNADALQSFVAQHPGSQALALDSTKRTARLFSPSFICALSICGRYTSNKVASRNKPWVSAS